MKKTFILGLLLFMVVACQVETVATPSPVPLVTALPATTLPTPRPTSTTMSTAVATRIAAPSPTLPQIIDFPVRMSSDVEGWYVYENINGRYRFSYPPAARVTAYSDNCIQVTLYGAGYILFRPAQMQANTPCQPLQLDAYDTEKQSEMIAINQQHILVERVRLLREGAYRGEAVSLSLPTNLILEYGIMPDASALEPDGVIRAVLAEIIASLRIDDVIAGEVTPTPIAHLCLSNPSPVASARGLLRVTFLQRDRQKWLWREETGKLEALMPPALPSPTVPGEAVEWISRADDVIYLLSSDAFTKEIWMSDYDGQKARLLATIAAPDITKRFEWATSISVSINWVGESGLIRYITSPSAEGLGEWPIDTVGVIETGSGERREIIKELESLYEVRETPDNRFLIALLPDEVRLIEIATGAVTSLNIPQTVYADDNPLMFSPDDKKLLLFGEGNIAVIDLMSFQLDRIDLPYAVIGLSHDVAFPRVSWHADGETFSTLISDVPKSYLDFSDVFRNDVSFSVWQVNIRELVAEKQSSFMGNMMLASMSPNGRYLTFMHQDFSNERTLYLADVQTGEFGLYDQGRLLQMRDWAPNGQYFIYQKLGERPILGQLCQPPQLLTELANRDDHPLRWVDDSRYLYFEGSPETNEANVLYLVGLDGTKTAVAQLDTAFAVFDFYFE